MDNNNSDAHAALKLLYEECVHAGHKETDGYGWPKALSAAREVLGIARSPSEIEIILVPK